MQGIRAFVGHSFSESDKDIVRIFADHFDNLEKAHSGGFTWDHAEEAEALPLSQKVLAKIQNKNVFIGICTRKERAVEPEKLKPVWWGGELKASDVDLVWKTSDWIIQEIGLAVGRNMSIIIFLEDGVRVPGGLYGNTEYIQFSRANPHQSFDKFLQMLVALSPKETTAPASESKAAAPEEKGKETEEADLEPKADWSDLNYDSAAIRVIIKGDEATLDKIDAAFKNSIHAQGSASAMWEARIEYFRILFGKKADFGKMKRLAEEHAGVPEVLSYAASAHEEFEEFLKAAEKYEEAARVTTSETSRAHYLGQAAVQYSKSGDVAKASQLVADIKTLLEKGADAEADLTRTLKLIAEQQKDEELQLVMLEHEVEDNPTDTQKRFALAYKYSETENQDMALYHYLKIPVPQRDPTTWNNIGVSYGDFRLPVKGVRAFKRAADAGETLAMSNLGNKLLNAGFFDEAKVECKKALAIQDYHKNVATLLNRLKEAPDEEETKLKEALEKVKGKADFLRDLGAKALLRLPKKSTPIGWPQKERSKHD